MLLAFLSAWERKKKDMVRTSMALKYKAKDKVLVVLDTQNLLREQKQFYLEHLSNLGPLLCRVLWLNEQVLQQCLFVELTHQLALQMLFHKVHQEVHHCLGHAADTQPRDKVRQSASIATTGLKSGNGERRHPPPPPSQGNWICSSPTCLGCFCGQWGSSSWWGAGWPHSPSAPWNSACVTRAPPGRERERSKMWIVFISFESFVLLLISPLTVSRRLMAWPLLGLPKPAGGAFSSATFSFFQRFPPSRASAWQWEIWRSQRVKAILAEPGIPLQAMKGAVNVWM